MWINKLRLLDHDFKLCTIILVYNAEVQRYDFTIILIFLYQESEKKYVRKLDVLLQ
jgi:hypothetical protein